MSYDDKATICESNDEVDLDNFESFDESLVVSEDGTQAEINKKKVGKHVGNKRFCYIRSFNIKVKSNEENKFNHKIINDFWKN